MLCYGVSSEGDGVQLGCEVEKTDRVKIINNIPKTVLWQLFIPCISPSSRAHPSKSTTSMLSKSDSSNTFSTALFATYNSFRLTRKSTPLKSAMPQLHADTTFNEEISSPNILGNKNLNWYDELLQRKLLSETWSYRMKSCPDRELWWRASVVAVSE